ncbi:SulP family inorganic anion transporter [Paenibacillus humicola]|uniref:SulP family inorganic anion transporter n=1 Tax=Paenibacillus humicola TaxID=3110540 RepID=UPI00237B55A6|nr:SulP family inorganic anion transporter [Paenibacillus humicola]
MKWSGRFEGYGLHMLRRDLVSGLIVGIVAIPLAMSFAIASGVKPQFGIYTTIIAGFLISLLGGSRFQIGGPTGAFIPVLLGIVLQFGYGDLLIAGMLAGVLLILMGVFRLGALIQFIPRPVTVGFTSGIAVIIFSGQIANFLGLRDIKRHDDFLSSMKEIGLHISTVNPYSITTAAVCLAVIVLMPRLLPRIPASLIGLVASALVASVFFHGKLATIGSAYGVIPSTLPTLVIPHLTFDKIIQLLQPAFVIAMLGGIESLLSAVVADGMSGSRHNSNRELIGQGIANLAAPLFGGIPATGAIARTATNIKSGAASPVSGMVHSIAVLIILMAFAPLASAIPLAGMAPILMVVAWNMSERKEFVHMLKMKSGDSLVMLLTFLLTVLTTLTTAVEIGLVMAVLMFVIRMRDSLIVSKVLPDPSSQSGKVRPSAVHDRRDCPQISIYSIEGPLFFGAANQFERSMADTLRLRPKVLLLRMAKVPFIDATGEAHLASVVGRFRRSGGTVLVSGIRPQPKAYLHKTGLAEQIGEDRFYEHTGEAIGEALGRLELHQCAGCKHNAFRECAALSCAAAQTGAK